MNDTKTSSKSEPKQTLFKKEEQKSVVNLWEENESALSYQLKEYILSKILLVLPELKESLGLSDITIDSPVNEKFGDYTSNVALVLASRVKQSPRLLAEKIVGEINDDLKIGKSTPKISIHNKEYKIGEILERVEGGGGGFVNLWLQISFVGTLASLVLAKDFGSTITHFVTQNGSHILGGKKIMIEFAHPNTHKEFHIGHLRNISIGESLVRMLQVSGADLFRANYEGDVGLHVGKAIWGVYQKLKVKSEKSKVEEGSIDEEKLEDVRKMSPSDKAKFLGEGYALGSRAYEESIDAKKEIIALNKKIYTDPKSVDLWEETRGWSLDYFNWIYQRLGTHFDRLFFESEVEKKGRELVRENVAGGIFIEDKDGSIYFPGEYYGLNNCVFVTRENYATYEGKDVALEHLEHEVFPYDLDIHVVANEQKNFFQIAFAALEAIYPYQKGKQYHLAYGMVNLKGAKLSSRTGKIVTADMLIDEAKEKILKIIQSSNNPIRQMADQLTNKEREDVAEKVAVGAVKYSMLKVNPKMDIAFDLEESVSIEGDSGPYLQYTYARCQSVMRKAESGKIGLKDGSYHNIYKEHQTMSEEEKSLLRSLRKFSEVVSSAGRALSPNLLSNYLFDISQKYNLFYNKHSILGKAGSGEREAGSFDEIRTFRLVLTEATANILKAGLYLLGIETVERM